MKHFFVLFLCMTFAIGQGQEKVSDEKKCEAVLTPSEILQWQYIGFMKDSIFYKSQFANFTKVKNGILLCNWQEGSGSNRFSIVDFDNGFNASLKTEQLIEEIDFSEGDKKKLKFIFEILEKASYYQRCSRVHGHSTLYILVVRCNNEMKVQYYWPFTHPYEIKTTDANVNSIQEIFHIMEYNYYKSKTVKNTKKKTQSSQAY
ncbi:hypothetical protein K6T82_16070 [Flavobacterium sp. 17A]|uniref:Uncharacterized protein n=1 Tax=Flavobacterium potami TaxID=2872310 RepID=A0A9X1HBW1_9FLAO|nr:hypothetical protein [Flavobacterium potami]MBZ4036290.1 hypothetical protein [Flavobacterium potami]